MSQTVYCLVGLVLFCAGLSSAQEPGQKLKDVSSQEVIEQWRVLATSPGVKILSEQYADPGMVLSLAEPPLDEAYAWVADKGLEEGRNLYDGKLLYISVGSAAVNAKPSDPNYIDSRVLAFQRAELEAKAKTAIYLGVDLTTSRGSSEREINPQERNRLEELYEASKGLQTSAERSGVASKIKNLFLKAGRLAEKKLDDAIKKSGVDVDAEKEAEELQKNARKNMTMNLRNISEASLEASASALSEVQGSQIIAAFEGSYHGNYQVAVVTLWSQNLQRLVQSMQSGNAPLGLPQKEAKEELLKQLPDDPNELCCLIGVKAYINQNGEHTLLSFGQAGVNIVGNREDKAFEKAGKKARLRAMAAMRSFMGETIAFRSTEKLRELLALYSNEYQQGQQDYISISKFQEMIEAEANREKLVGIHGLFTKEDLKHPFTDKPLILKVMAWSPSSQALAKEVKQAVEHGPDRVSQPETQGPIPKKGEETPARKGTIGSGKADKDAW